MKLASFVSDLQDVTKNDSPVEIDGNDYAVKKVKIIAQSGSGKTYTASKIVEELLVEKIPVVVVDPIGHYWGLKEKFPIVVFGNSENKHADHVLQDENIKEQAELLAKFVATTTQSVIIDLDGWTDSRQQLFGGTFAKVLYKENKHRRHVLVEEADIFIPQSVQFQEEIACRHYFDNLVRRGRGKGIGVTVVTQRPALVSKNVLSQADLSVVLCLSDATDLEPAKKMINADLSLSKEDKERILDRIMKLPKGEAFFYSPRWLGLKAFVKVLPKVAYHSGATRGDPDYREEDEVQFQAVNIDEVVSALAALSAKSKEDLKEAIGKMPHLRPQIVATPKEDTDKLVKEAVAKVQKEYAEKISAQEKTIADLRHNYEVEYDRAESLLAGRRTTDALASMLREFLRLKDLAPSTSDGQPVEVTSEQMDLAVKVERKSLSLSDKDPLGRLAILIAGGFFDQARSPSDVYKEVASKFNVPSLLKGGGKTTLPYRNALTELCLINYGYLKKDAEVYLSTGKKIPMEEVAALG